MKVACMLITHFPVKAELRRQPHLWGRALVITEGRGSQRVALDSSPEARGVKAGMPLQEALSHCKGAVLLEEDQPYYNAAFDRVLDSLLERSPLCQ